MRERRTGRGSEAGRIYGERQLAGLGLISLREKRGAHHQGEGDEHNNLYIHCTCTCVKVYIYIYILLCTHSGLEAVRERGIVEREDGGRDRESTAGGVVLAHGRGGGLRDDRAGLVPVIAP